MEPKKRFDTAIIRSGERGFTLVEVMIAMFMGVMIALMLFVTLERQSRTFTAESQKTEAQLKVVSVADLMVSDIRLAGYLEPEDRIQTATSTEFAFRGDVDHSAVTSVITNDIDIGPEIDQVVYKFDAPSILPTNTAVPDWDPRRHNGKLWRSQNGMNRLFVDNMDMVKFKYYDAAGSVISYANLAENSGVSKLSRDRIARIELTIVDSATAAAVATNMDRAKPEDLTITSRAIVVDVAPPNLTMAKLVSCGALVTQVSPSPLKACDPPGSIAKYTVNTYQLDTNGANVPSTKNTLTISFNPASSVYTDAAKATLVGTTRTSAISLSSRTASSYTYYVQSETRKAGDLLSITANWQPPEDGCYMKYYTIATPIAAGYACGITPNVNYVTVQGCDDPSSGCNRFQPVSFTVTDKCGNPVPSQDVDLEIVPPTGANNADSRYGRISRADGPANYADATPTDDGPITLRGDVNGVVALRVWASDMPLPYSSYFNSIVRAKLHTPKSGCDPASQIVFQMTACKPETPKVVSDPIVGCMNSHYPIVVSLLDHCGNRVLGVTGVSAKITSAQVADETLSEFTYPFVSLGAAPPASSVAVNEFYADPGTYLLYYNTRTDTAQRTPRDKLKITVSAPSMSSTYEFAMSVSECACNIVAGFSPTHFCDAAGVGGISLACLDPAGFVAHGSGLADDHYGVITASTSQGEVRLLSADVPSSVGDWPKYPSSGNLVFSPTSDYSWPFWMNNANKYNIIPVPINGAIGLHLDEYDNTGAVTCTYDYSAKVLCSQSTISFVSKDTIDEVDYYYPTISYDFYDSNEKVYVELRDCNLLEPINGIDVTVYDSNGDMETIHLTNVVGNEETFYRNATGLPITALAGPTPDDGTLQVGVDDLMMVSYTDPTPDCGCIDYSYDILDMAGFCISAALYDGRNATFGESAFKVHWGDVITLGIVNFSSSGLSVIPKKVPTMSVADTVSAYSGSTWQDRWFDLYANGRVNSASATLKQPYYSSGYPNIYQKMTVDTLGCIMAELDYDAVKTFAINSDVYYYAKDNTSIIKRHSNGKEETPVTLAYALANDHRRFIFVDLINAPNLSPQPTGATIDAGNYSSAIPTFTLSGNLYYKGFLYIAGNLEATGLSGDKTITATTPPLRDKASAVFPENGGEQTASDLPVNYDPASSAGVSVSLNVNINGTVYLKGYLSLAGNMLVYGSLAAENGFKGSGVPEIWYNYSNARGCGQKSCCVLEIYPSESEVVPNATQQMSALGGSGGQIGWSITTNNSGGTISSTGLYTAGPIRDVTDVIQAVQLDGACKSTTTTIHTACPVITVTGDNTVYVGDPNPTYTATGGVSPYTWTSSNTAFATIGATTGALHAVAQGTVTITATDANGCTGTFTVGILVDPGCVTLYGYGFEGAGTATGTSWITTESWTSCSQESGCTCTGTSCTSQIQDDWSIGPVYGKCPATPTAAKRDPSSAASGSNIMGTDLGGGSLDGCYPSTTGTGIIAYTYEKSPTVIGTGYKNLVVNFDKVCKLGTSDTLKFYYKCGATGTWTSPFTCGDAGSTQAWTNSGALSLSPTLCDNNAAIWFKFELKTSNTNVSGGWNIDNFNVCGYLIH